MLHVYRWSKKAFHLENQCSNFKASQKFYGCIVYTHVKIPTEGACCKRYCTPGEHRVTYVTCNTPVQPIYFVLGLYKFKKCLTLTTKKDCYTYRKQVVYKIYIHVPRILYSFILYKQLVLYSNVRYENTANKYRLLYMLVGSSVRHEQ